MGRGKKGSFLAKTKEQKEKLPIWEENLVSHRTMGDFTASQTFFNNQIPPVMVFKQNYNKPLTLLVSTTQRTSNHFDRS